MSEGNTSTPASQVSSSKKRELPSPDFPSDLKKNRVLDLSVSSSESELNRTAADMSTTMDDVEGAEGTQDAVGDEQLKVQSGAEKLHISLEDTHMKAIAAYLKESFRLDMKESIQEELPEMVNTIVKGVISGLNEKISQLELDNQNLKTENQQLKSRVKTLEVSVDVAEQYSRRNSLRMSGVPETATEDTDTIVLDAARDIDSEISLSDIDRSHRVGKPKVGRPRDIIIKFATYRARQKLYKQRTLLKDRGYMGVFLNEDLTKLRMDLLYKARVRVKSKFLKGAWSSDGTILVKDNADVVHRISCEADLSGFNTAREDPPH